MNKIKRGMYVVSKTKKYLSLMVVIVFALTIMLAGCGGQKTSQSSEGAPAPQTETSQKKVEVVFWHNMNALTDRQSIEDAVQTFNKEHPNIEVKAVLVPGTETDATKLMTAVAAGEGPDVYYLDRFTVAQRAHAGMLEPLEDYLTQLGTNIDDLKSKFFDFAIEEATYKGKLYALPWDTDARVLYYNKKLFKEAGLDPERPPQTISELDEYANKLTKVQGGKILQIGFIPWRGQGWPYTWGWVFGGKFYDHETKKFTFADDPKIVASLEWQKTYADKYGIKNIDSFFAAFGDGGGAEPVDPFMMGKEAMRIDGNWFLSTLRKFADPKVCEWGIAPIPYPGGREKDSTWAGGWSLVIPKGAKHPKEAAEFIQWMATKGAIKYAKDTAHFSAIKEGTLEVVKEDPDQKLFYELLNGPNAHSRPVVPVGALVWDELVRARDDALYGKKVPQQALKEAQEKVQKELDKALSE